MSTRERWVYRLLVLVGVVTLVAFYGWWLQPQHVPDNVHGILQPLDVAIFGLLTLVVSHRVFMDVYTWVVARKIEPFAYAPAAEHGLRVAFITTFVPGVEGLDLLRRTLPAMLGVDYPHDVWLLDEGDDAEARGLAEELGVRYFTRSGSREYNLVAGPFTRRTKGGNHNSWYDRHRHDYDIVAQIDTDFIPRHDFLTQTLGHFEDPAIGWVVTPQIYGNDTNLVTRGAAQQQYTFYGPVLRGLSGRGMASMLGANHVVRVAALDDVGLYAGHVTEDLLTGMRLHSKGWRSIYVPLPLAVGEGPDTWAAYFAQQMRWSYGCMDVLRNHSWRLSRSLSMPKRLLYLSLQQGYFSGLAGAVGTALLAVYFLFGVEVSRLTITGLVIWGLPLFGSRWLFRLWLQRFTVRPKQEGGLQLSGGLIGIAVWPIYFAALVKILRQQPMIFKVTPKGSARGRAPKVGRRVFRLHAMWAVLSAVCLGYGLHEGRQAAVLVFWAAVNVAFLGGIYLVGEPAQRWSVRRSQARRVQDVVAELPAQRLVA